MSRFYVLFDLAAFATFVAIWVGYGILVERTGYAPARIHTSMNAYRKIWLARTLDREVRMLDMQIMAALQNGVSLYASISLLALGGAIAILRLSDEVISIVSRLPFAIETTRPVWEGKSIGLAIIFAYAIIQFSSSYRIYNWVAILLGAMPLAQAKDTAEAANHVKRTVRMNEAATRRFYRGQRAVFFALGYLGWFFGPLTLIASTAAVVIMMWRLEFPSDVLRAIEDQ